MPGPRQDPLQSECPEPVPEEAEQGLAFVEWCLRAGLGIRAFQLQLPSGRVVFTAQPSDWSGGRRAETADPALGPPSLPATHSCVPSLELCVSRERPGLAALTTPSQGWGPGPCGISWFLGTLDEQAGILSVALALASA